MDDIILYNELKGDILRELVEIKKWELAGIKFGKDQSKCIEREKKLITIYEASEAVKKFHELYLLTEEGDDIFECFR